MLGTFAAYMQRVISKDIKDVQKQIIPLTFKYYSYHLVYKLLHFNHLHYYPQRIGLLSKKLNVNPVTIRNKTNCELIEFKVTKLLL